MQQRGSVVPKGADINDSNDIEMSKSDRENQMDSCSSQ